MISDPIQNNDSSSFKPQSARERKNLERIRKLVEEMSDPILLPKTSTQLIDVVKEKLEDLEQQLLSPDAALRTSIVIESVRSILNEIKCQGAHSSNTEKDCHGRQD